MGRPKTNNAYNYFIINKIEGTALCILCQQMRKTIHGSNLLRHLKNHHKEAHEEVVQQNLDNSKNITLLSQSSKNSQVSSWREKVEVNQLPDRNESEAESNDEESIETDEVTAKFERQSGGRAKCKLCRATVPYSRGDMANHMQRKHPKYDLSGMKTESDDPIGDDNSFNEEVVYLDEPLLSLASTSNTKRRKQSSSIRLRPSAEVQQRKREASPEPKPSKYDEEIEKFGAYVIHLLKSTPQEVCTKLQMDIISLIMSEKLKFAQKQKEEVQVVKNLFVASVPDAETNGETSQMITSPETKPEHSVSYVITTTT